MGGGGGVWGCNSPPFPNKFLKRRSIKENLGEVLARTFEKLNCKEEMNEFSD